MNQDTLWLQVPSAKIQSSRLIKLFATPNKLENISNKLATLQSYEYPFPHKTNIILFIADHGISLDEKIPFAQPVSKKSLSKFNQTSHVGLTIAKLFNAKIEVINLGTKTNFKSNTGIINSKIDSSTENFCHAPAMNSEQLAKAINIGRQTAQRIKLSGSQLFVASEINDANKFSALAMTCALLNISPAQLTEINTKQNKLIQHALIQHKEKITSPLEILRHLGSFEIAALTGSYLCCAHMGIPALIDGLASTVAALVAARLCPSAEKWFLFSHDSNSAAQKLIFKNLNIQPLLQLNHRMDNIAGIIATLSLLQLACAHHNKPMNYTEETLLRRHA